MHNNTFASSIWPCHHTIISNECVQCEVHTLSTVTDTPQRHVTALTKFWTWTLSIYDYYSNSNSHHSCNEMNWKSWGRLWRGLGIIPLEYRLEWFSIMCFPLHRCTLITLHCVMWECACIVIIATRSIAMAIHCQRPPNQKPWCYIALWYRYELATVDEQYFPLIPSNIVRVHWFFSHIRRTYIIDEQITAAQLLTMIRHWIQRIFVSCLL